jgi:uncharacterized protein
MTAERDIDYETLAQNAMRGLVRTVLLRVAKSGLPGEHHFYIAFKTDAPGVSLSKRLKQKYPEEMTVVLQHRFWDLIVSEDRFEVKLTFDGIAERLEVPFAAVKVFFDPSVPYGLQFEEPEHGGAPSLVAPSGEGAEPDLVQGGDGAGLRGRPDKKTRAPRKAPAEKTAERPAATGTDKAPAKAPAADKVAEPGPAANESKVVKLDTFRKK